MSRTEGVIYVVTDGMGGQVDSWWQSADDAQARADKLNAGATMTLAWGVVSVNEGSQQVEVEPHAMTTGEPMADKPQPPTDEQLHLARAVLEPLTDTQRRAVLAVVAYETAQELGAEG